MRLKLSQNCAFCAQVLLFLILINLEEAANTILLETIAHNTKIKFTLLSTYYANYYDLPRKNNVHQGRYAPPLNETLHDRIQSWKFENNGNAPRKG